MDHTAQLVAIDTLKPYKGNARIHDLDAIRESLRVNGQYRPVVVRAKTREVLAGNGTLQALKDEGTEEIWATFVDVDAKTAKRIVIVDNRTNDLAGYDDELLAGLLQNLPSVEGTGWSERELVSFVAQVAGPGGDTEPGEAPAEPRTKLGDLWVLGEHRLLCEDCRAAPLPDGAIITDPPYGVDYADESWDHADEVANDAVFAWVVSQERRPTVYFCGTVNLARELGRDVAKVLIWHKPWSMTHSGIGNGRHHWEPLIVRGIPAGAYLETDVLVESTDRVPGLRDEHSCPKPVELLARLIAGLIPDRAALVIDPFAGSGSTLIACENLSRRCYAMEIDPGYCDVIVERWERHTGGTARRADRSDS